MLIDLATTVYYYYELSIYVYTYIRRGKTEDTIGHLTFSLFKQMIYKRQTLRYQNSFNTQTNTYLKLYNSTS